jgi:hypothetical protein
MAGSIYSPLGHTILKETGAAPPWERQQEGSGLLPSGMCSVVANMQFVLQLLLLCFDLENHMSRSIIVYYIQIQVVASIFQNLSCAPKSPNFLSSVSICCQVLTTNIVYIYMACCYQRIKLASKIFLL